MNIPHTRWVAVAALIIASIGVFVAPFLMHGTPAQANTSTNPGKTTTTTSTTGPTTSSTTSTTGTTRTGGTSGTSDTQTGSSDDSSTKHSDDNQASDIDNDDGTQDNKVQGQTGTQGTDDNEPNGHHETCTADQSTSQTDDDAAVDLSLHSEKTLDSGNGHETTELVLKDKASTLSDCSNELEE